MALERKTPESKTHESKEIERFINFDENTMNPAVTASVGIALLKLKSNHFDNMTEESKENAFKDTCEQIEEFAGKEEYGYKESSVAKMIAAASEPVSILDYVTIWVKKDTLDEKESSGPLRKEDLIEERHLFHLKHVLTLVWMALNKDSEFERHYREEKAESDIANPAELHRKTRIRSFFLCLNEMDPGICHHGRRNGLVSLLDNSYSDLRLILDPKLTVLAFLRDEVSNIFWRLYVEAAQPEQRKKLNFALITWMNENNPKLIIELLNLENLQKLLEKLFLNHGCNPLIAKKLLETEISSLAFFHDSLRTPYLTSVHHILEAVEMQGEINRNHALIRMQKWIEQNAELNNISHQKNISSFYAMHMADTALKSNNLLLEITGKIGKFKKLAKNCIAYFQSKDLFPLITEETNNSIKELNCDLEEIRKDALTNEITNFFARWFSEDKNEQQRLYAILLDPNILEKRIILDDKSIEFIKKSNKTENNELLLSPYEINRIFLSAITIKPHEWTADFSTLMSDALEFAKKTFNQPNRGIAEVLKRDSYPDSLLNQLEYLVKVQQFVDEEKNPRPVMTIMLTEHSKTFEEWVKWSKWLSNRELEQIYQRCSGTVTMLIMKEVKKVTAPEQMSSIFYSIINSIPPLNIRGFLSQLNDNFIRESVSRGNYADFFCLLRKIPIDNRLTFLERIGVDYVSKLLCSKNNCFIGFALFLPKESRVDYIKKLGKSFINSLPKDRGETFMFFLSSLSPEDQWSICEWLGHEDLQKVAEITVNKIIKIMHGIPANNRIDFLNLFAEPDLKNYLSNSIKDNELSAILNSLPLQSRYEFLAKIGRKFFIDKIKLVSQLSSILLTLPEDSAFEVFNWFNKDFYGQAENAVIFFRLFSALPENSWNYVLQLNINSYMKLCAGKLIGSDNLGKALEFIPKSARLKLVKYFVPLFNIATIGNEIQYKSIRYALRNESYKDIEKILSYQVSPVDLVEIKNNLMAETQPRAVTITTDEIKTSAAENITIADVKRSDLITHSSRAVNIASDKCRNNSIIATTPPNIENLTKNILMNQISDLKIVLHELNGRAILYPRDKIKIHVDIGLAIPISNWPLSDEKKLAILKNIYSPEGQPTNYKALARKICKSHYDNDVKRNLLGALTYLYKYERSIYPANYTSMLGLLFGYHKQAKVNGANTLLEAIDAKNGVRTNGVWGSGDLGAIASAYRSLKW